MHEPGLQGDDRADTGNRQETGWRRTAARRLDWPAYLSAVALLAAVAVGYVYVSSLRERSRDLAATVQSLSTSLAQVQTQLQTLNERIINLSVRTPPVSLQVQERTRTTRSGQAQAPHNDSGLGQIQSQLSLQQKQIAGAREDIDRTRSDLNQTRDDLQNNLNSAKDELNGSIARTHDEVAALQKRGERNYYEFAIDKSKQYSRVGPLSIELRNADTKRKRFDMTMLVEDNELQKKSVNLYETVWISLSNRPQPLELVVNKIAKNHIEGYVSEPKYN
jgi:chromosome segregation ATPase